LSHAAEALVIVHIGKVVVWYALVNKMAIRIVNDDVGKVMIVGTTKDGDVVIGRISEIGRHGDAFGDDDEGAC
jgi:hypothetical protein